MANLFEVSDFALFTQYQGKTQEEAPDGQSKLRPIYDKLGYVLDVLRNNGYHTEINRNPLIQGGPATMKYCPYHWSKIYPKDDKHFKECEGKVFIVLGSTQDGIDIHIDSNSRKGFDSDSNKIASELKNNTWLQIAPNEASLLSCEELANKVDVFFQENWIEFNLFAKEFGVQESVEILNKMEIEKIKKLLIANHNIILTGAPGTGKTYLAKDIAKSMGAEWMLVQFHPSYDYTDFVEGLRPFKNDKNLGFERKDGVFKAFCKEAINSSFNDPNAALEQFKKDIKGSIIEIPYKSSPNKEPFAVNVDENNKLRVRIAKENDNLQAATDEDVIESIKTDSRPSNKTYAFSIGAYIKEHYMKNVPYVFIIDEINRGEIAKIFGELFYSVDAGYRGVSGKVRTQYQNLVPKDDIFGDGFYIPKNVYIICTMNDIDRSVESLDFAMRRRFAWKEITAKSRQSMLDYDDAWGDYPKPSQEIINEIKVRMDNLNNCIIDKYESENLSQKDKIGLTKAYQIGASYFLKYGMYNNFDELWENHLEGLLYEYLRGTANIEIKIERLKRAYNDIAEH